MQRFGHHFANPEHGCSCLQRSISLAEHLWKLLSCGMTCGNAWGQGRHMKLFAFDYLAIRIPQLFAGLSRPVRRLFAGRTIQNALWPQTAPLNGPRLHRFVLAATISSSIVLSGCSMHRKKQPGELQYWDGDKPITSYRGHNTSIEHAALDNITAHAVQISGTPRNLQRNVDDEVREVTLHEMMLAALSHNEIIETTALGGVGSKVVLTNPNGVASVYDSAIQETGVLFGRRGLDAALSDFDTRLNSSLTFNGGTNRQNSPGFGLTPALASIDTQNGAFNTGLSKSFATGASVAVNSNFSDNFSNSAQSYTARRSARSPPSRRCPEPTIATGCRAACGWSRPRAWPASGPRNSAAVVSRSPRRVET